MPPFKNFIVLENGDIHYSTKREMIDNLKIIDDTDNPEQLKFAKIYILPPNGDLFEQDSSKWILKIEKDIIPFWWSEYYKVACYEKLKELLAKQIIVGKRDITLDEGLYFLKNCQRINLWKDVVIKEVYASTIGDMKDNAQIINLTNSTVYNMWNKSHIRNAKGASVIYSMNDESSINILSASAVVEEMKNITKINVVQDSAFVWLMQHQSLIYCATGSARIKNIMDDSGIYKLNCNAVVENMEQRSFIQSVEEKAMIIKLSDNSHFIKNEVMFVANKTKLI